MIQLAAQTHNPNMKGDVDYLFASQMAPFPDAHFSEKTAQFHGFENLQAAIDVWKHLPHPAKVYKDFGDFLDVHVSRYGQHKTEKIHMVGYNILRFDEPVLRFWFRCLRAAGVKDARYAPGCWFWQAPIDVMPLAADALAPRRGKMENFQLATVARTLGIEVNESQLHGALYDVSLTRAIYYKLKEIDNGDQTCDKSDGHESEAAGPRQPTERRNNGGTVAELFAKADCDRRAGA